MEGPPTSSLGPSDDYWSPETAPSSPTPWTRHQDKVFEHALVMVPENSPNRWLRIAGLIPGKSPADVSRHYDALVSDLLDIDSGRVQLPSYADDDSVSSSPEKKSKSRPNESERKKGKPWTKKEHQLFLLGLKKFGKGDWRSISRSVVITRTPTQVASHAQKYFLRQESAKKDRKRSSIHDITTVEGSLVAAAATDQYQLSTVPITQPPPPWPSLPQQFASASSYFPPNQRSLLDY